MMDTVYKDSKWASEILALQKDDGSFGFFHALSEPRNTPVTTEQALRRLQILGYTYEDKPIQKCVEYMNDCLIGKKQLPDRREKVHTWYIFTELMLSTWIRRFTMDNEDANSIAESWAQIITHAFSGGSYSQSDYNEAYIYAFGVKPKGGRLIDFVSFYPVSLTSGLYDERTEGIVFDHILDNKHGIYYIYGDNSLRNVPERFMSIQASRYLRAIELLSEYRRSLPKLQYVVDWLNMNRKENGKWDMGGTVIDKVYFPLSDSWRRTETRVADCTYRIQQLVNRIDNR